MLPRLAGHAFGDEMKLGVTRMAFPSERFLDQKSVLRHGVLPRSQKLLRESIQMAFRATVCSATNIGKWITVITTN